MIDLTAMPLVNVEPEVQDFGGVLTPPLGGPVQRIDRVGTRWTLRCETPRLPVEPELRLWSARLARAKRQGAVVKVPEPQLTVIAYGSPVVAAAVIAGSSVPLRGLPAGAVIVEGKWLSIIRDGRRYLHQVTSERAAASDGRVTVGINPPLRVSLAEGDVVELAAPKMQGTVTGAVGWSIPIDSAPLTFVVAEDE